MHIEPTHRFASGEAEKECAKIKKNIDSFISTTTTALEDFFNIMQLANKAKSNISTGLALINEVFSSCGVSLCVINLVDRFASTKLSTHT